MSKTALDARALAQLFTEARTYNAWTSETLSTEDFRRLYELTKLGPTSANTSPARFVFVASAEGKRRLAPCLSEGNRAKTLAAPVCVVVAYDLEFASRIPQLFPHKPEAAAWFADPEVAKANAARNASLQAAYLIMAARALGFDAGPMGGFDAAGVDAEFFAGTSWRSSLLVNIGKGDPASLQPRLPRLSFEDACRVA